MVIWSIPARNDLKNIHQYISKDSSFYASRVIDSIVEKSEQLETHPKSGRMVPEIGETSTREVFIYSYRLIYEVKKDNVFVLAVIHGARILPVKKIKRIKK